MIHAYIGHLINKTGVITYLTQLLDTGFFHADPHPGNMLRSPDGRLVVLDFGLMTVITENQKYGMIEAIAHLIHRWGTPSDCSICFFHLFRMFLFVSCQKNKLFFFKIRNE